MAEIGGEQDDALLQQPYDGADQRQPDTQADQPIERRHDTRRQSSATISAVVPGRADHNRIAKQRAKGDKGPDQTQPTGQRLDRIGSLRGAAFGQRPSACADPEHDLIADNVPIFSKGDAEAGNIGAIRQTRRQRDRQAAVIIRRDSTAAQIDLLPGLVGDDQVTELAFQCFAEPQLHP